MKVVGISRSPRFSPNSVAKDMAIFETVVAELVASGCSVLTLSEDEYLHQHPIGDGDLLFSMARDTEVIDYLEKLELQGVRIVNAASGVKQCSRYSLTEKILTHRLSHPESWLIKKVDGQTFCIDIEYPCWVKRGDACAQQKEDVCFVQNKIQMQEVLRDFACRAIDCAVVNKHIEGDLVKFYSVAGTDFFYWSYPSISQGKFGLEMINGDAMGYAFKEKQLKEEADRIAHLLNVPVYGGDAIILPNGHFYIIDFNDWPSFSPCCEEAGKAIAQCIVNLVK